MVTEEVSPITPSSSFWQITENNQDQKYQYFLKYLPFSNSSIPNSIFYVFSNKIPPASLNYFQALG